LEREDFTPVGEVS